MTPLQTAHTEAVSALQNLGAALYKAGDTSGYTKAWHAMVLVEDVEIPEEDDDRG